MPCTIPHGPRRRQWYAGSRRRAPDRPAGRSRLGRPAAPLGPAGWGAGGSGRLDPTGSGSKPSRSSIRSSAVLGRIGRDRIGPGETALACAWSSSAPPTRRPQERPAPRAAGRVSPADTSRCSARAETSPTYEKGLSSPRRRRSGTGEPAAPAAGAARSRTAKPRRASRGAPGRCSGAGAVPRTDQRRSSAYRWCEARRARLACAVERRTRAGPPGRGPRPGTGHPGWARAGCYPRKTTYYFPTRPRDPEHPSGAARCLAWLHATPNTFGRTGPHGQHRQAQEDHRGPRPPAHRREQLAQLAQQAEQTARQAVAKAGELTHANRDKVDGVIEKVSEAIDLLTKGEGGPHLAKAKAQVAKGIDMLEEQRPQTRQRPHDPAAATERGVRPC